MYNIQTFYGWQTQYKCVMSTHKIFYEYTQMCPHSTTKYTTNTPLGVGADSSRPYLPSINSVSVCHHFMGVYIYAGTINRTPTAADELR